MIPQIHKITIQAIPHEIEVDIQSFDVRREDENFRTNGLTRM